MSTTASYQPVAIDVDSQLDPQLEHHARCSSTEEHEPPLQDPNLPQDPGNASQKQDKVQNARRTRSPLSGIALWDAALDFALILPAVYFLAFAFIVYTRNGTPLNRGEENSSLVAAAALGPTIFPIAFAAVVGRFLKSAAAWKVERSGATLATLEQLLGSKTVVSALWSPISIRLFNAFTIPLVILWALSPIGGQSSRRIIYTGPLLGISRTNVSYLDTNSPFVMGGLYAESQNLTYWPTYSAAYTSSLVAPLSVKDGPRDTFGNFKVPMIEYLNIDGDGFAPVYDHNNVTWSSLLGIATLDMNAPSQNHSLPTAANSSFIVESSYWNVNCSDLTYTSFYSDENAPDFSKPEYHHVRTESDGSFLTLGLQRHTRNATGPRIIYWLSGGQNGFSEATCSLTTTYLESNVSCMGKYCAVTDTRRSKNPLMRSDLSMLDYTSATRYPGDFDDWQFFVNFLWAIPSTEISVWANPNQIYMTDPATPCRPPSVSDWAPDIALEISKETFSKRFSQLLNTAWLAGISPGGVMGDYEPAQKMIAPWSTVPGQVTWPSSGRYFSKYTDADVRKEEIVVYCDFAWFAVLVVSSLAMLFAGVAGMVLDWVRRGPDMLGSFSSAVRDSRYCSLRGSSSMLDGSELTRELASQRVMLGDVAAEKDVGHVAVGMAGRVEKLRKGRLYD